MFKTFSILTKFGIVIFVLLTGLAGYATGYQVETLFNWQHLITFIGGLYFLSHVYIIYISGVHVRPTFVGVGPIP